jgi:hypothetical protein
MTEINNSFLSLNINNNEQNKFKPLTNKFKINDLSTSLNTILFNNQIERKENNFKGKRLKYKINNEELKKDKLSKYTKNNNNVYETNNKLVSLSRSNTYQKEDPISNTINYEIQRPRMQFINEKKEYIIKPTLKINNCCNFIHNHKDDNPSILNRQRLVKKNNFYNMNDSGSSNNDNKNDTMDYNSNNLDDHDSNEDYNKKRNSDNCLIY